MSIFAAAMTGMGTGAISTVQVFGEQTEILPYQQRIGKPFIIHK